MKCSIFHNKEYPNASCICGLRITSSINYFCGLNICGCFQSEKQYIRCILIINLNKKSVNIV